MRAEKFPLSHPLKNPPVLLRLGWVHRPETDFLQTKEMHFPLLISSRGHSPLPPPVPLLQPTCFLGDARRGGRGIQPSLLPHQAGQGPGSPPSEPANPDPPHPPPNTPSKSTRNSLGSPYPGPSLCCTRDPGLPWAGPGRSLTSQRIVGSWGWGRDGGPQTAPPGSDLGARRCGAPGAWGRPSDRRRRALDPGSGAQASPLARATGQTLPTLACPHLGFLLQTGREEVGPVRLVAPRLRLTRPRSWPARGLLAAADGQAARTASQRPPRLDCGRTQLRRPPAHARTAQPAGIVVHPWGRQVALSEEERGAGPTFPRVHPV